ncbi:MAG: ribonuclease P protein component [Bacteroidaceae bacterium]|nr:ribonuclease P protein component [Bacteroidaceae bacterium]
MPDTPKQTFRKAERLCSKKRIEQLFAGSNHSFAAYPLRTIYMECAEAKAPVEVLISVSKRHFKHAVDRNRIKRLVRESYRKNKHILIDNLQGKQLSLAFIWMGGNLVPYTIVEAKVKNLLQRIAEHITENGQ